MFGQPENRLPFSGCLSLLNECSRFHHHEQNPPPTPHHPYRPQRRLMHLGFNMFALGSFMPPLLRVWTAKRVWALYFASGLAGAAAYLPFMGSDGSMLGASGAVFGVLAAFSAVYPKAPLSLMFIPVPMQARYLVGGMVLYEVFAQISGVSLFGDNIAHMAHGGGALMGWAFAWQWQRQLQR